MRSVIFDLGGVVLDWNPLRLVERLEPDPQARAALLCAACHCTACRTCRALSAHVGLIKPERAIFELILGRYQLDSALTAFVDDHPPNIEAARALGLHAIRFADPGQCAQDVERWLE
jgi:FMN phosphatase YigB (HAD superfamily)